jgi:hypothetical protein
MLVPDAISGRYPRSNNNENKAVLDNMIKGSKTEFEELIREICRHNEGQGAAPKVLKVIDVTGKAKQKKIKSRALTESAKQKRLANLKAAQDKRRQVREQAQRDNEAILQAQIDAN